MEVLVYQHAPTESLGALQEPLESEGATLSICRLFDGEEPVDPSTSDLLIVLGGPDDLDDPASGPEIERVGEAVQAGQPVVGICLGAQMIARSLGAAVRKMDEPEIGFYQAHLTPDGKSDPVFSSLPDPLPVFHWHSDTVDLPDEAVLLATREHFPVQAFRVNRAYGLLFHIEMMPGMINDWISCSADELTNVPGANLSLHDYIFEAQEHGQMHQHVARLFVTSLLRSLRD